jgi:hypothetical protein
MKLLSINHGLITTTSPPSSLVSPLTTTSHSIPISVPKTHITNLNSNTSLSLTLFQYFILHAYKQVSHKSSSPPNTFIIMYDLLKVFKFCMVQKVILYYTTITDLVLSININIHLLLLIIGWDTNYRKYYL